MRHALPLLILALPPAAHAGAAKVVGGAQVTDGSWPDVVALFSNGEFYCSGVLVAPDVVLTAGHCDLGLDEVVIGARDYETDGEAIAIAETYSHAQSWSTYDVTAVVLQRPALAAPRTMALDCIARDLVQDGGTVVIAGYGAIDANGSEYTTHLYAAEASVVDADCTTLAEGCNEDVSPGGELIAGGGGVDSCNGDSGGPLYLRTEAGDFLVGTTSRATNSATVACGDGGIYVRVDAIADWVEEETGRTLVRPDCGPPNHPPEPTFEPASVPLGGVVDISVAANDPDPGDHHVWTLVSPPEAGNASVALDGTITYVASQDAPDTVSFTVLVTDDGLPEQSATLRIDVVVEPVPIHRGECGCGGGGSPSGLLLGLAALAARRRRTA